MLKACMLVFQEIILCELEFCLPNETTAQHSPPYVALYVELDSRYFCAVLETSLGCGFTVSSLRRQITALAKWVPCTVMNTPYHQNC